jgi:hypothetical protein
MKSQTQHLITEWEAMKRKYKKISNYKINYEGKPSIEKSGHWLLSNLVRPFKNHFQLF